MSEGARGPGTRRGGRSGRRGDAACDSPDTPGEARTPRSRRVVSRVSPARVLADTDVERIHAAALAILGDTGVDFASDAALGCFRAAGLQVAGRRVRLDAADVAAALATAPGEYVLHGRHPGHDVTIGGRHFAVMPGGSPAFIRTLAGERRAGRLEDLRTLTRLADHTPQINVLARKAIEAQDVPVPVRHLECWRLLLTEGAKPVQSGFTGGAAEAEDALEMLAIVHGGRERMRERPVAQCSVNVNSPLLYDQAMVESLMAFARAGQPVLITPFVMAGVSGPVTLAGALAQQHAEILAGVVLAQLVRPGAPVLYGAATSNVDMRSGAPATGSPEGALCIVASAQLARRVGLPVRAGGALTDAPVPDAQSQYERMFTLVTSALAGVNYVMHGAGILESYLTTSVEQFVIDLEMLDMVGRLLEGLPVDDPSLALDVIHRVGPGGMFLDAPHTLERYRDIFFTPHLSRREGFEQWRAAGSRDIIERARERAAALLDAWRRPDLDPGAAAALDDFVARRRREIGA